MGGIGDIQFLRLYVGGLARRLVRRGGEQAPALRLEVERVLDLVHLRQAACLDALRQVDRDGGASVRHDADGLNAGAGGDRIGPATGRIHQHAGDKRLLVRLDQPFAADAPGAGKFALLEDLRAVAAGVAGIGLQERVDLDVPIIRVEIGGGDIGWVHDRRAGEEGGLVEPFDGGTERLRLLEAGLHQGRLFPRPEDDAAAGDEQRHFAKAFRRGGHEGVAGAGERVDGGGVVAQR